jgi:hypothetical protein
VDCHPLIYAFFFSWIILERRVEYQLSILG